jgi:hypothetical protein
LTNLFKSRQLLVAVLCCYIFTAASQSLEKRAEDFNTYVNQTIEQNLIIDEQVTRISSRYKEVFGTVKPMLSDYSNEEVSLYFDIANTAFFTLTTLSTYRY